MKQRQDAVFIVRNAWQFIWQDENKLFFFVAITTLDIGI